MKRIALIVAAALMACLSPACLRADSALEEAREALEADLAAYRQAGEPAVPADLLLPSVPDAANGALELRSASKAIDSASDTMRAFGQLDITTPLNLEQQQTVRTIAAENAEMLELVDAAIAKGRFDWQVRIQAPLMSTLLPHLAEVRADATIVQAAAIAAHLEGDDDLALRRIQQLLALARSLDQQPFLISYLVSWSSVNLANDACVVIAPALDAQAGTPTRKRAESLIAELLDETSAQKGLLHSLQSERVMQADTALAIADGKLQASALVSMGRTGPDAPTAPADLPTAQRIALEDARIAMQHTTGWLQVAGAPDWPTAVAKIPPKPTFAPDHYYGRLMLSAFDRAIQRGYVYRSLRRMAAISLAARCYAIDHAGKMPASLADLTPQYLPTVPSDPFTMGQPMRYLAEKSIVYSVGLDGGNDGGKEAKPRSYEPDIVVHLR